MPASLPDYKLSSGASVLLDLLRGVSALAVVVGHALYFYGFTGPGTDPSVFVMQGYAVLVFFLLSGFLITYSTVNKLRRNPAYGFTHFFIDRFARIYSGFVPALIFVLLLDTFSRYFYPSAYIYESTFDVKTFVGNLFLLQDVPGANFLFGKTMTSFGSGQPFWTLAAEWWIYLFFGWVVLRLLPQRGTWWVNLTVLAPLLLIPSVHLWGGAGNGLMMTWLIGALAYLVMAGKYLRGAGALSLLPLIGWLCAVGVMRFRKTGLEYDAVLAFISAAVLVALLSLCERITWPKGLEWLIRKTAAFSFTLYLIHYSIMDLLRSAVGDGASPWVLVLMSCLLSIVCAAAIGLYTETTLTRWVKKALHNRFSR